MITAKLTSKGQITIPKDIRSILHLETGDHINFIVSAEGDVLIKAVSLELSDLEGMLPKPAVPVTLEEMDQAIIDGATKCMD